jgi:hypothetical protein
MCYPIWLFSRKYGTVWYHPASSKLWYLTALSFVNFQEKLTGTSFALCVWSQLCSACCVTGVEYTFCVNRAHPKAPQGHKYNPLGAQGGVIDRSIHQRAADRMEKHREEADGRRKFSSCLGDGLAHALAAMVGPAWWSHGGVLEPMPWFHQGNCTFYIQWWYKSCLFFTLIYIDECFIHMYS